MSKRVAICAMAQIKNEPDIWYQRFQGMLLDCLEPILKETGVTFVFATHDPRVIRFARRVIELRDGLVATNSHPA